MNPQVGDIVQVKEEHIEECGIHMGIVEHTFSWPEIDTDAVKRPIVSCVIFRDPYLVNPIQLQTRYIEVVSKAAN